MGRCGTSDSGGQGLACHSFLTVVVLLAFIVSLAAIGTCEFSSVEIFGQTVGNAGLFQQDFLPGYSSCEEYPDEYNFDPSHKTARAGGLLGAIFFLIALIILIIQLCCCKIWCGKFIVSTTISIGIICQGLTFFFYNSDLCTQGTNNNRCDMGPGAIMSVVAWAVMVLVSCFNIGVPEFVPLMRRKRERKPKEDDEEEPVKKEEEEPVEEQAPEEEPPVEEEEPAKDEEVGEAEGPSNEEDMPESEDAPTKESLKNSANDPEAWA